MTQEIIDKITNTTIVDLKEAYMEKYERIHHPKTYYYKKLAEERKKGGLCIKCGRKHITANQKKQRIVSCDRCREKRREVENENKNNTN